MKKFLARIKRLKLWKKLKQLPTGRRKKWRYRRHVLPRRKWPELIKELEIKLANPYFFSGLEYIGDLGRVRLFYYEGIPVAIKDTGRLERHGFDYEKIRKALLVHQKAVLEGKIKPNHYRIVTPKVYGQIGRYLIMEYIEHKEHPKPGVTKNQAEITSYREAYRELEDNFMKAIKISKAYDVDVPQLIHLMVLGNTNPKNPKKGTWLFSLPYDLC
ncbi:MAG: hypothetical protein J7L44_03890 [Candidatus Diapherotrites archaeon]|nr:hypothetical protein [Candidatus Diapherotrites archaeon]